MLSRAGAEWESRSGSIHASGPALPAPARKRGSRNPESRPSGAESQGKYCSVRWKRTRLSRHKARNRKESIVVCAGSARDYHLPFGQEIKSPPKAGFMFQRRMGVALREPESFGLAPGPGIPLLAHPCARPLPILRQLGSARSRNPESRPSGAESQGKYCSVRWKRTRLSPPIRPKMKKPAKSGLHVSAPNGSRTHVSSLEGWGNSRYTTGAIVVRGFRHAEKKVALVWRLYSAAAIRPARLSCVAFATRRSDPCQDSQ